MWSQFKQLVVGWFQTNGWLLELGVVGFFAACFIGLLVFALVLAVINSVGGEERMTIRQFISSVWHSPTRARGLEWFGYLGLAIVLLAVGILPALVVCGYYWLTGRPVPNWLQGRASDDR